MGPLRLALVCAVGVLLVTPQVAAGGGWWSHIDVKPSTVAAGQRVEVDEDVAFDTAEEARAAGRFYVYLLRDFDDSVVQRAMRERSPGDWWSLGGAEAIRVGQVDLSVSDANMGTARAAFTVPELPPATYHLMLCDAGCAEPLADVIPTAGFTVVADPATALMAQRVDRLERRIREQARRLRAEVARARAARFDVEQLEQSASDDRSAPPETAWSYAGWLVAGALALLVLRRRPDSDARRGT